MTDDPPLPPLLRLKQRIATSPLASPVAMLRGLQGRLKAVIHPELGLLHQEGRLTDACLRKLIRPDWNCLDVGGHLGSVSWTLSRLAPRGRLHIVEASPAKAAALRALGYASRPVFHQHFGREPVTLDAFRAFRAFRLYPFTAFNFFATPTMGAGPKVTP